jgi:hypothetical protein
MIGSLSIAAKTEDMGGMLCSAAQELPGDYRLSVLTS